jgi:hypothetical protein
MSDRMVKTVRLPLFDEKDENYAEFHIRFFAYVTYHRFAKAVAVKPDPDLPREDMDTDVVTDLKINPKIKKALERNDAAMCNYTMALDTMGLLEMVNKAKSKKFTNGEA